MTTFSDIFKSGFLDGVSSVSLLDMALVMVLAFMLGLFIFFVYKKTCQSVMYSAQFGGTLIAMTLITAMVILAVTSNVVLSLGMVGALSIVRFRAAIKEPMDIAYLFWAIAAGIVLAAGMIPLAVVGSVVIGVFMLLFMNHKTRSHPYIAILCVRDHAAEQAAVELMKSHVQRMVIKSKTAEANRIEMNWEVRLKDENTDFVTALSQMEGVESAVLVSYNGDYRG